MKKSYGDWNQYFIEKFFLEAAPQSLIRLHVSKEWFEAIPARDGQGGFVDFLNAMSEASQQQTVYDSLIGMLERQRRLPDETPAYVAYLVFLCLPWTWAPDSNNVRNYWERLGNLSSEFKIDCGRLIDPNYRFSRLLSGNRDLLSLLRDWSQNNPDIQGEFVYCHLYTGRNDQISLLRSQVWPTDADLAWMPELLFCRTNQGDELEPQQLFTFCQQEGNIAQAWPTFRNLFLAFDSMARLVKQDAFDQIYEVYEEWVDAGRPLAKVDRATLQRVRQEESDERRNTNTLPHAWLRLRQCGHHWERSIFLRASDFTEEGTDEHKTCHLALGGRQYDCSLTCLPSGNYLIKNEDEIWLALAGAKLPFTSSDFAFSSRKCYVMLPSSSGTFLQQDFVSPGQDFWALYSSHNKKSLTSWMEYCNVHAEPPLEIGWEWMLQHIHGLNEEQCRLFPNGLDNERQSGLFVRLVGGIKARDAASRRRYLREFLPNIEAYLPTTYSIDIWDEYGRKYDQNTILHEMLSDEESFEETPTYRSDGKTYLIRTFTISLPSDFSACVLNIQFNIDGEHYGRTQKVRLATRRNHSEIQSFHAWDHFGNVVPRAVGMSYWPEPNEGELVSGFLPHPNPVYPTSIESHEHYWKFVGQLMQIQGNNGIPRKDFWSIVCSHYNYVAGWKRQIQYLSHLGILDIRTNEFGLWTGFYLNDPALCLLPTKNERGKYQAILSGAFAAHHIEDLMTHPSLAITLSDQQYEQNVSPPMLPPHVLVTADRIKILQDAARECTLEWGGIPSRGFALRSVSLEGWLASKQQYVRDGNPKDEEVTGWYNLLGYHTQRRDAEGHLSNPLRECPALFTRCMCSHPCPTISGHNVFDLVNREQNQSVYVKDIPWGRWVSYLLEGYWQDLRFRIAYNPEFGTLVFPEELMPPRVLARALTLCTGRIPLKVYDPMPYNFRPEHGSSRSPYGLSSNPDCPYQGACHQFMGVPRDIAEIVAEKLHCEIKEY